MKITVLVENTSENELVCEHGLSLLIEQKRQRILLDAGSTDAFLKNAQAMGISLKNLDAWVLSHGHYDHSGGFEALFQREMEEKVYAQKSALDEYYSAGGSLHKIGVPPKVSEMQDRFILVDGFREILPGVYLVPHSTKGLEGIGERSRLYKEKDGELVPDDFSHEQSLVIDTEKGLVIFNSCSHGGVETIVHEVRAACGGRPVYAYVGGLHMKGKRNGEETCTFSDVEIDALCEVIRKENIRFVYTGHCTGKPGFEKLRLRLGEIVQPLTTGKQFAL